MKNSSQIRRRAIDRALRRNPDGRSWQQLAAACYESFVKYDVGDAKIPSRRTIMNDLRDLRSGRYGPPAPIEYVKGRGYFYGEPGFELHPEPLTTADLATLLDLADWAEQLTYGQLPVGFSDTVHRLADHLRTRVRAQHPTLRLDRPAGLDGREHLPALHQALLARRPLRLTSPSP